MKALTNTLKLTILLLSLSGNLCAQDLECADCGEDIDACNGQQLCDILEVTGGTPPYTFTFSNNVSPATGNGDFCDFEFSGSAQNVDLDITIEDDDGETIDFSITLTVNDPDADFSFPTSDPCSAQCVQMTNESVCLGCVSYEWTVNGSGVPSASDQTDPCLDLLVEGTGTSDVTVGLTIVDDIGCSSSATAIIGVTEAPPLSLLGLPSFEQCSGAGTFGLIVADGSGADYGDYQITWDIDDPTDIWTSADPPNGLSYDYPSGIFTLEYCVTNADGCTHCMEQQVTNLPNPNALFGPCVDSPVAGCAPLDICFEIEGLDGNPAETQYFLDLGNGEGQQDVSSLIQDCGAPCTLDEIYNDSSCPGGNFEAEFVAQLPGGACIANVQTLQITVAAPPMASITGPAEACVNESVTFQNFSTAGSGLSCAAVNIFTWYIDGVAQPNQFLVQNLTTSFSTPGTHLIELCVDDFECDVDCMEIPICITEPPVALYDAPVELCVGDPWNADNLSTLETCSGAYLWTITNTSTACYNGGTTFGFLDGTTTGSEDLALEFYYPGTYQVSLDIIGPCNIAPYTQTINVVAPPEITLASGTVQLCPSESLCLDQLFCVAQCLGPLMNNFELNVYAGSEACGAATSAPIWTSTILPPAGNVSPCFDFGGCTYNWPGSSVPGTYTVEIYAENDCGPAIACTTFEVLDPASVDVVVPASVCGGTVLDLCALSPTCTWESWNGSTWVPIAFCDITLTSQTDIRATCNSGNCPVSQVFTIDVYEAPAIGLTGPPNFCPDETIDFELTLDPLPGDVDIDWYVNAVLEASDVTTISLTPAADVDVEVVITVNHPDGTSCQYSIDAFSELFVQPYAFDCSWIEPTYCSNTTAVIDPADFFNPYPGSDDAICTLNGSPVLGPIVLSALAPGVYDIVCTYTAPVAPGCVFMHTCSFEITDLLTPQITGTAEACLGSDILLELDFDPGLAGSWTFTSCPGPCPGPFDYVSDNTSLTWNSLTGFPGVYEVEFSGECMETTTFQFTINETPPFTLTATPGQLVCEGDVVDIALNYTGTAADPVCVWTELPGTDITPDADCGISVTAGSTGADYQVSVTDEFNCTGTQQIGITIQQQPFTWDCSGLLPTYCANDATVINPETFMLGLLSPGDLSCTLNGAPFTGSFQIDTLAVDDYVLECTFTQTIAPFCSFTNTCNFSITGLTTPVLVSDSVCLGEALQVALTENNDLLGTWELTSCPTSCAGIPIAGDASLAVVNTTGLDVGNYTFSYSGNCLETVSIDLEVFPLPDLVITADPGDLICSGEEVDLTVSNNEAATLENCNWLAFPFGPIDTGGDCIATVIPSGESQIYQVTAVDANDCEAIEQTEIFVQQQPFTLDCSAWADPFCANSQVTLQFSDIYSPLAPPGTFAWTINGDPAPADIFVPDLGPGVHDVCYSFTHADGPNCVFTGCCTITVNDLTMPTVSGTSDICQGGDVDLDAVWPAGFPGDWTFTTCPAACPTAGDFGSTADDLSWNTSGVDIGAYLLEYTGECLDTAVYEVTVHSIPEVDWIPVDATPCLNECFELEVATLNNADVSGWCLDGGPVCDPLATTFCPGEYSAGEALSICFWAEVTHDLTTTTLTCFAEDCHTVDPVESPGGYPVMPDEACPETVLDIGVNSSLYDDCTFILEGYDPFEDCANIFIPTYGTFADTLFLEYDGCFDTLTSEIYVPEPPSASLALDYDECVALTTFTVNDLSGDDLQFSWDIDFPLDDDGQELPVPNPVPYGDLGTLEDAVYYVDYLIFNQCDNLLLQDSVVFVALPSIGIDLSEDTPFDGCSPEEVQLEIFLEYTDYIDEVVWDFGVDYMDDLVLPSTTFPPLQTYEAFGAADTVTVTATASNQCGSDVATTTFIIYPPDVFVELPFSLGQLCPGETIDFEPTSVSGDPWAFEMDISPAGGGLSWNEADQTFTAADDAEAGVFDITYTAFGCGEDSDLSTIEILSTAQLDFQVDGSPCSGDVVDFTNLSVGGSNFEWLFGDGGSSDEVSPSYSYDLPGTYNVQLSATSSDGCPTTYLEEVEIAGPNVILTPLLPDACSNSLITFAVPPGDFLSIEWTIETAEEDPITYVATNQFEHLFTNNGSDLVIYDVTVTATDFSLCEATNSTQVFIKPVPNAYFSYAGFETCANGANVTFTNLSTPQAVSSLWSFGDGEQSIEHSPEHFYQGAGNYTVRLDVVNAFGCEDHHTETIPCADFDIFVPNAFTPDDDRINDVFHPVIYGVEFINFYHDDDYVFRILDRWGHVVFETHDPLEPWIGDFQGGEFYAQNDVYEWQLEVKFPSGRKYKNRGHVTLVR